METVDLMVRLSCCCCSRADTKPAKEREKWAFRPLMYVSVCLNVEFDDLYDMLGFNPLWQPSVDEGAFPSCRLMRPSWGATVRVRKPLSHLRALRATSRKFACQGLEPQSCLNARTELGVMRHQPDRDLILNVGLAEAVSMTASGTLPQLYIFGAESDPQLALRTKTPCALLFGSRYWMALTPPLPYRLQRVRSLS